MPLDYEFILQSEKKLSDPGDLLISQVFEQNYLQLLEGEN